MTLNLYQTVFFRNTKWSFRKHLLSNNSYLLVVRLLSNRKWKEIKVLKIGRQEVKCSAGGKKINWKTTNNKRTYLGVREQDKYTEICSIYIFEKTPFTTARKKYIQKHKFLERNLITNEYEPQKENLSRLLRYKEKLNKWKDRLHSS